jgi:hypothetical protein
LAYRAEASAPRTDQEFLRHTLMATVVALLATLIGVFITPDGIVVGADTSISNRTGQVSERQKYCVTGPRAVATLQGVYYLQDLETKTTAALYDDFQQLCAQLDKKPLPAGLRDQAVAIADMLRTALEAFLAQVPADEVVRAYASQPVIARIAVSGYDERGPASVIVGLGVATDATTNRWETQVRDLARLSFRQCGVRFHGQEVVVEALRSNTDARISSRERQRQDVTRLTALLKGSCADASTRSASTMFAEAVRLTVMLGNQFGVPQGSVSLPLDIVVIPSAGKIEVSRITSW